jgi:hypothetical protein
MPAFFKALVLLSIRLVSALKKSSTKLLTLPRLAEAPDKVSRRFINPVRSMLKGLRDNPAPNFVTTGTTGNLKLLAAGAIAGVVSRTLVSPLEVVATINMAAVGSVEGPRDALIRLWTVEGLAGFYKGNRANCLKVAPTKGIQFVSFEFFKRQILILKRWHNMSEVLEPAERLIAGGFAGMIAAACVYPLETAKSLLTIERGRYGGSIFNSLKAVVDENGLVALYRGLVPTLIAMFPYVGVEFCTYETLRSVLSSRCNANAIQTMSLGAFAGTVAQASCHPLDVVRKRLQLQGIGKRPVKFNNMFDGLAGISKAEGRRGLYKGLKPACLATLPSTGCSYVVYEYAKGIFGIGSAA